MRIVVFGTGGVGGYFGGRLAQAGEDVVFIARGEHLRALRTHGLRVESLEGDFVIHPVQATDDPAEAGTADVVLVGVKTWQIVEAAQAMSPLIGPDTMVLPLQNGVETPGQLAAVLGKEYVLGGLCGIFSFLVAPGHIRHAGITPFVKFGELDNQLTPRVERLREAFERAGVTAEVPPDIHVALWMKFLFITPLSGIGAVTRAPVGVWRSIPHTRQMAEQALQEIATTAQARGIRLPSEARYTTMRLIDSLTPATTSSMQRDIMAGRPSELDAQVGAVVRLGNDAGVETPVHAFLYASLLPLELQARGEVKFPI